MTVTIAQVRPTQPENLTTTSAGERQECEREVVPVAFAQREEFADLRAGSGQHLRGLSPSQPWEGTIVEAQRD